MRFNVPHWHSPLHFDPETKRAPKTDALCRHYWILTRFFHFFGIDHMSAVVVAACRANPMSQLHRMALRAFRDAGRLQLKVRRPPRITALFGCPPFWYRHLFTPPHLSLSLLRKALRLSATCGLTRVKPVLPTDLFFVFRQPIQFRERV